MADISNLIHKKDLTPQPWGTMVQALPGDMFLLNPSLTELHIIALYVAEVNRLNPLLSDTTVQ